MHAYSYMYTYLRTYIHRQTDRQNQSISHFRDLPWGVIVNQNKMDIVPKAKRERERDAAAHLNITKPILC